MDDIVLLVANEATEDEVTDAIDDTVLLIAEEATEDEVAEVMDDIVLLIAEEITEDKAVEGTDDVPFLVAEEVSKVEIFMLIIVEVATLADDAVLDDAFVETGDLSDDDVEEQILEVDETTDKGVFEDEIL